MALAHALDQMVERSDPAAGDHRNADRIGDGSGQLEIVAALGAVAVHRRDQQFARPQLGQPHGVFECIDPGWLAPAMGEDFPAARLGPPRIDRADDALAAKARRDLAHQLGPFDRGGIDRHLVRPRQQQRARIRDVAHPAAHGQRHEANRRSATDDVNQCPAPFVGGGNVEKTQLVGPRRVVGLRLLDRIARIPKIDEIDALDHTALGDVETGDDADADGHRGELSARLVIASAAKQSSTSSDPPLDCRVACGSSQ